MIDHRYSHAVSVWSLYVSVTHINMFDWVLSFMFWSKYSHFSTFRVHYIYSQYSESSVYAHLPIITVFLRALSTRVFVAFLLDPFQYLLSNSILNLHRGYNLWYGFKIVENYEDNSSFNAWNNLPCLSMKTSSSTNKYSCCYVVHERSAQLALSYMHEATLLE